MTESLEGQALQDRLNRLQELTDFTENCKKQLNELFEALGWTQDSTQEEMEQCPYDPNHRVPVRSMERHKTSCQLSKLGYSREEQAEMYDPTVFYENANISSFTMDKDTQHQVILQARASAPFMRMEGVFWRGEYSSRPPEVPRNHKRALCDLTVADRLALYDHVTRVTNQQRSQAGSTNNEDLYVDLVAKLKKADEQNTPKSKLEMIAEMRDYKRRRQSYRAKNVHITKKSYTEVIREVIEVHSGELARQWREEKQEEEEEEEEEGGRAATHSSLHRRRSNDGRSASTESFHSHLSSWEAHGSHSRRHRSREHSRERGMERSREHSMERSMEHSRERSRERGMDRGMERSRERSMERSQERSRERSMERSPGKESKKKRKRDSRSPDDRHHHHDRKKKKKKKHKKEKRHLRTSTLEDGPDEVITTSE